MNDNQSLVSVIIPFYNTPPHFMREALESVLCQNYHTLEILLINDGSDSESAIVAQEYAEKFPATVLLYHHPNFQNRGISASRQLGIQKARGQYIAFLDADDIWLPEKLEEQVALLEQYPEVAMVYGNALYWYSWTGEESYLHRDYLQKKGMQTMGVVQPLKLLPLYLLGKTAVPCTGTLLIRKKILETRISFEEVFTDMYEDQVFYAKISLEAPIYVSGKCWLKYRLHPKSVSAISESSGQNRATRDAYLEWLVEYLQKKDIRDPEIWRALRREIWFNRESNFLLNFEPGKKAIRRLKKWLLKFEEWFLPAPILRWLWAREFKAE